MSVLGLNGKSTSDPPCRAYIASTPDQAIIFLQLDTAGQCRTGKIKITTTPPPANSISSRSEISIFCPVFCVINGTFYYLCSLNMMML